MSETERYNLQNEMGLFDQETRKFLNEQLDLLEKETNDPYVDNWRVTALNDAAQRDRYEEARNRGCCGSAYREVFTPDGRGFLIGFNYGH